MPRENRLRRNTSKRTMRNLLLDLRYAFRNLRNCACVASDLLHPSRRNVWTARPGRIYGSRWRHVLLQNG